VVWRCEVVLDGSCQLREDGSAALERLDRGQRAPASVVSDERADPGAVHGRFHVFFCVENDRCSHA